MPAVFGTGTGSGTGTSTGTEIALSTLSWWPSPGCTVACTDPTGQQLWVAEANGSDIAMH